MESFSIQRFDVPGGDASELDDYEAAVVRLFAASRGAAEHDDNDLLETLSTTHVVTVHDEDDELVAVAALDTKRPDDVAWLDGMAVKPRLRGEGVGSYLFDHLVGVARDAGKKKLAGLALASAVGFYERIGLSQDDELVSGTLQDDLVPFSCDI